jgi:uncharacterized protein (AIM24 family)
MITYEIIGDDMQAVVLSLGAGDEIRAEAGAMTYMTDGIEMDARTQGGLGEGFILERLEGTGDVFIHSGGTIVLLELSRARRSRSIMNVSSRSTRRSTTTSNWSAGSRRRSSAGKGCSSRR